MWNGQFNFDIRRSATALCVSLGSLVMLIGAFDVPTPPPADVMEFRNGQWFDGTAFVRRTAYAVDGVLSFTRPVRVDGTVDLQAQYVIPPYAETHTHALGDPAAIDGHIQEYLRQGVFYVMVQDAARELGPEILDRVNRPDSVDVTYTRGVEPGLDPKLLPSLVEKTHARGLRISTHVETATDFGEAVRAGVDMIAHLPGWQIREVTGFRNGRVDHWKIRDEDAQLAAQKRIAIITTAARETYDARADEINRHNLELLRRMEARVVLGADGFEPASIAKEAQYVARTGGFDNAAIVRMLTESGPQLVFPSRKIGALREGYEASFLSLRGNPLESLDNLTRIELRVKGGRLWPSGVGSSAQGDITRTHVGGSVYLLDGAVDLIGVSVGDDGVLMVDGGYMETLPKVRAALESFRKGAPRIVINTHWHHGFANEGFGKTSVLVAHRKARELLARENFMFNRTVPAKPAGALPLITFENELSIHFNGEDVRLVYLPQAHTDGDIAVIFPKSNVVMTGDVFVPHVPWTDVPAGGTVRGLVAAIDRLVKLVPLDAKIIPGHGRISSHADLRRFRDLLRDTITSVRERVTAGKSLADVQAAGIPSKYRDWQGIIPVETFLAPVYAEIKAGKL